LATAALLRLDDFFPAREDFFARVALRAARAPARPERAVFFDFRDDARFDAVRDLAARFLGLMVVSST
jgi:hypothetical protein